MKIKSINLNKAIIKVNNNLSFRNQLSWLMIISITLIFTLHPIKVNADINWSGAIINAFETSGSSVKSIRKKTKKYTPSSWFRTSVMDVGLVGAGACGVPGAGYAALPVEFVYLMREIYNSSMGLGFLINGEAVKDDFAIILGIWSDEIKLKESDIHNVFEIAGEITQEKLFKEIEQMSEKNTASIFSGTVASQPVYKKAVAKPSSKIVSKLLAKKTGAKVAGKLSAKIAGKTGAKIGAKYAAKTFSAWIPFISAAVCGGLNMWIMDGIMDASEEYYTKLAKVSRQY